MPLVAAAYLAFAAGLLSAFAGAGPAGRGLAPPVVALAVLAAAAAGVQLARGRRARGALALLVLVGVLLGWARREEGHRCRAQALAARSWTVVLESDATPGAPVRARLADESGCRLVLALVVDAGQGAAGARVRVRGEPMAAEGRVAVRVARAQLRPLGRGAWTDAARARARRASDRLFGDRSGLVAALLVAERDGLSRELRERFADAGIVHVLAVSGLHVAVLAAAVELLAAVLRLSRRGAAAAGVLVTVLYVAIIGSPPSAVRAAGMLAVAAASRLLQRPTSPWASLALGATVPLLGDVAVVLDLGYQLSVVGIAALVAGAALTRRLVPDDRPGWQRWLAAGLLASAATSLATAPIVAYHFGRVSVVGLLTNLVAAPLVGLLQPTLFLALVLAPLGAPAALVADAARPLLAALDGLAAVAASLPGAALEVQPTLATALLCGAAAAAGIVAAVARRPTGPALLALAALGVAVALPLAPPPRRMAELHLLDVGQGDAIALRSPAGRWVLVDAGRVWTGGDAGQRTVAPYVRRRGGAVAAFMLSHPHADHVGGAASVLARLRPVEYWDPGYAEPSAVYRGSLEAAARRGVRWRRVRPGDSLAVDGLVVTALAPDSTWASRLRDANSASTVLLVRYGAVRFLLTGDAELAAEQQLLGRWGAGLRADVLKVAHHGSATSSSAALLAAVRPRVALVSVGAGNRYGHPSPAVVARLLDAGAQVLRTDQLGHVVVRTDGRHITLEADGERWTLPASSRPSSGGR